ncbi:MAG: prephenate dehydratase [Pseudomonadota bacterium]
MDPNDISKQRETIDRIDRQIIDLLEQRADCASEIGRLKRAAGLPVFDPEREVQLKNKCSNREAGLLPCGALKRIFTEIVSACRAVQQPLKVAFLGPEGTFTHVAAMDHFGGSCEFMPRGSIVDVFSEVERGDVTFGVVPVENSTEGSVGLTLDQLAVSSLKICGEIVGRVCHALMSRALDFAAINTVLSHPQALAQCREWLVRNLPHAVVLQESSTAAAARRAAEEPGTAAVGGEVLAEFYGLQVLARNIQDRALNMTRFIVLGTRDCPRTGKDKTSIVFATAHRPGTLHHALSPFSEQGINLTRIESRPAKDTPWRYIFFVDFEGHVQDGPVAGVIEALAPHVERLKILGSYPAGEAPGE